MTVSGRDVQPFSGKTGDKHGAQPLAEEGMLLGRCKDLEGKEEDLGTILGLGLRRGRAQDEKRQKKRPQAAGSGYHRESMMAETPWSFDHVHISSGGKVLGPEV